MLCINTGADDCTKLRWHYLFPISEQLDDVSAWQKISESFNIFQVLYLYEMCQEGSDLGRMRVLSIPCINHDLTCSV